MASTLVYVLVATLWASASPPGHSIDATATYQTYSDCYSGAKKFFYDHIADISFPHEANESEVVLDGGVHFSFRCEGYTR